MRVKLETKIIFLKLKGESKACIEKQESSQNLKLELQRLKLKVKQEEEERFKITTIIEDKV